MLIAKSRLAPTANEAAPRDRAAHLRRRAHERPQPGAAPGCNPPCVTLSLGLDPEGHRA